MSDTTISHDANEHGRGLLMGGIIAVVLMGSLTAFIEPPKAGDFAQIEFNRRFGGTHAVTQLSPAGYEALRDMVAEDPKIAKAVLSAFDNNDGIDTAEMRAIVGDKTESPRETSMGIAQARADLYITAYNMAAMPPMDPNIHQE